MYPRSAALRSAAFQPELFVLPRRVGEEIKPRVFGFVRSLNAQSPNRPKFSDSSLEEQYVRIDTNTAQSFSLFSFWSFDLYLRRNAALLSQELEKIPPVDM